MALIFLKTVTLTGRARRAPPEDRDSTHVGNLDCQILSGGDLILSPKIPGIPAHKKVPEPQNPHGIFVASCTAALALLRRSRCARRCARAALGACAPRRLRSSALALLTLRSSRCAPRVALLALRSSRCANRAALLALRSSRCAPRTARLGWHSLARLRPLICRRSFYFLFRRF